LFVHTKSHDTKCGRGLSVEYEAALYFGNKKARFSPCHQTSVTILRIGIYDGLFSSPVSFFILGIKTTSFPNRSNLRSHYTGRTTKVSKQQTQNYYAQCNTLPAATKKQWKWTQAL